MNKLVTGKKHYGDDNTYYINWKQVTKKYIKFIDKLLPFFKKNKA